MEESNHTERVTRANQLEHPLNFEADGRLYLVRCCACGRENYGANVSTGCCTWCGWCDAPVSNMSEKSPESAEIQPEEPPNDAA